MNYQLLHERLVYDQVFQIKKAKIKHDLFDSGSMEVERYCFERGDSVAIVLYEKDTNSMLFTNQFRYPTIKETTGWILELTAGSVKADEDPVYRVKKEVEEEICYQVTDIEFISSFLCRLAAVRNAFFFFIPKSIHPITFIKVVV